jgi:hypothetical protein
LLLPVILTVFSTFNLNLKYRFLFLLPCPLSPKVVFSSTFNPHSLEFPHILYIPLSHMASFQLSSGVLKVFFYPRSFFSTYMIVSITFSYTGRGYTLSITRIQKNSRNNLTWLVCMYTHMLSCNKGF